MAKPKENADNSPEGSSPLEKIARILGFLVAKDIPDRGDQVHFLRSVGFEISEVAALLNISEVNVRVASHHARKKKPAKNKKS